MHQEVLATSGASCSVAPTHFHPSVTNPAIPRTRLHPRTAIPASPAAPLKPTQCISVPCVC